MLFTFDEIWFEIGYRVDILHKETNKKVGYMQAFYYNDDIRDDFEAQYGEDAMCEVHVWAKRIVDYTYSHFDGEVPCEPKNIYYTEWVSFYDYDEDISILEECEFGEEYRNLSFEFDRVLHEKIEFDDRT